MFLLFAFDDFHPLGGPADVVGVYDSFEAACRAADQPWGRRRPVGYDNAEIWVIRDGRLQPAAEWEGGRWVEIPEVLEKRSRFDRPTCPNCGAVGRATEFISVGESGGFEQRIPVAYECPNGCVVVRRP